MLNTFLFAMLLATLILMTITRLATERLIHQHHGQKCDFFHHYQIKPGDIVFLGDSLTDGARWDELFPNYPVKNRGINADLTTGLLSRLDDVVSGQPSAAFILIGTNDLPWYEYRSNTEILQTYESILMRLQQDSPQTKVHIQSIFPRDRMYAGRISKLNSELSKLAEKYQCPFIDLHSLLVNEKGVLKPELTNDGLHLLAGGYKIWVDALTPYMEKFHS